MFPRAALYLDAPGEVMNLDEMDSSTEARAFSILHYALKGLLKWNSLFDGEGKNKLDLESHYLCCLACCRSKELRTLYSKFECALLRDRLYKNEKLLYAIIDDLDVGEIFERIRFEERGELRNELEPVIKSSWDFKRSWFTYGRPSTPDDYFEKYFRELKLYCVPFRYAVYLMSKRQCLLKAGYVYLHGNQLIDALSTMFQDQLMKKMEASSRTIQSEFTEPIDERVIEVCNKIVGIVSLKNLPTPGKDHVLLTAGDLEQRDLKKKFPLCMRLVDDHLRRRKHLMHEGKLQYILFLKGCGMTMQQVTAYLMRHSRPELHGELGYQIRHLYGKEGQKKSKPPYNCQRITRMQAPDLHKQCHGCPFRYLGPGQLKKHLTSSDMIIADIESLLSEKDPIQRCTLHLKSMLKGKEKTGMEALEIKNPNQWFKLCSD